MRLLGIHIILFILISGVSFGQNDQRLKLIDVFELEYAADPQIAPDGKQIVYTRKGYDIMTDKATGSLWILNIDGSEHRKLTHRDQGEYMARWSPKGDRIAYVSGTNHGSEIYIYWTKSRQTARISQLPASPKSLTWSPDGQHIAFHMKVDSKPPVIVNLPAPPKGAKWAKPPRITDRLKHEVDGSGYIAPGYEHICIMPADGGSYRQLSSGTYNHGGSLSFSPDGKSIFFSANRHENWEYDYRNSYVYKVDIDSKKIIQLTDQQGPDKQPIVSPDGTKIAFLSYHDKVQTYQPLRINIMRIDGSQRKVLSGQLDRSISKIKWDTNSSGIYGVYDEHGNTKIAHFPLSGEHKVLASNVGGTTLGRPYPSGSYSVSNRGRIAYTLSTPKHPADIAVTHGNGKTNRITSLNSDILDHRVLGDVEEVWYKSSIDNRDLQGWIVKPPFYDTRKKYPLLVENHGGPILNYGDRFSMEIQLYAADDYIVFYPNPRGSTSYGEEFGNLLYNNYPGEDYNDVMDGVDMLVAKGLVDNDNLFVTGGSAGGIMTAWMIGKNNRFKAAVVTKPVINWISKTLVADNYFQYAEYRYPGQPWENFDTYWKFSPISLVGNIQTPTMVMVGLNDLRTPPSEAKQLYHALKLRKIPTVLVEIPGAAHGIARRPSQMMTKVAHTLAWINAYKTKDNN